MALNGIFSEFSFNRKRKYFRILFQFRAYFYPQSVRIIHGMYILVSAITKKLLVIKCHSRIFSIIHRCCRPRRSCWSDPKMAPTCSAPYNDSLKSSAGPLSLASLNYLALEVRISGSRSQHDHSDFSQLTLVKDLTLGAVQLLTYVVCLWIELRVSGVLIREECSELLVEKISFISPTK